MPIICPTILATNAEDYKKAVEKVAGFAHRLQIDLTDGQFAKPKTVEPKDAWWPAGVKADVHLMFAQPLAAAKTVLEHKPNLVIVHAEAGGDFNAFASSCQAAGVKVGVALLAETAVERIAAAMDKIDHVLIFSGSLGQYGGVADLKLLHKARYLRELNPEIEIGWDGGINANNISQLAFGGVDVFSVGSFIQNAGDPEHAYRTLERIAEETGTT